MRINFKGSAISYDQQRGLKEEPMSRLAPAQAAIRIMDEMGQPGEGTKCHKDLKAGFEVFGG
jgi:hypothetical protein